MQPEHYSLLLSLLPIGVAYLLGSIPFGLVLAKNFCGIDPRTGGSGNVGATNVARLCGKKWGFFTLACDLGKGIAAILIAKAACSHTAAIHPYTVFAAGIIAIVGHMYPVFLNFKGGKGVATTVGVYFALAPLPFMISGAVCILVIWRTGFVSAGSLVMVSLLPVLLFINGHIPAGIMAVITGALVFYAHRENIQRLAKGEEKPWITPKKEKQQ